MTELLHREGFLGTNANFAADMTLVLSILVAVILTVGFIVARAGNYKLHKWIQTSGVVLNVILVLWLMVLPYKDFVIGDNGGPRLSIFYVITTIHATVGFIAYFYGVFVVLRGHNIMIEALKFNNYKAFMRLAYGLYMLTTLLGIWVYITWFVTISNPPLYQ